MAFKFNCERLQEVEVEKEEIRRLHHYLDANDKCYFLGEFTSHRDYSYSDFNQLIFNLKKPPSTEVTNSNAFFYKTRDIGHVAKCLRSFIREEDLEISLTIVPIPPSKTRTHPDYDDRILRICTEMVSGLHTPDVKELICSTLDRDATHNQVVKPRPCELMRNYQIVAELDYKPRSTIILIDDMLTTGTHFKACKNLLINSYTNIQIVGLFIARRIFAEPSDSFGGA